MQERKRKMTAIFAENSNFLRFFHTLLTVLWYNGVSLEKVAEMPLFRYHP